MDNKSLLHILVHIRWKYQYHIISIPNIWMIAYHRIP